MKPQVGILLNPKTLDKLKDRARLEYSTPAAIGRRFIEMQLMLLESGFPESALQAMAGKKGRR